MIELYARNRQSIKLTRISLRSFWILLAEFMVCVSTNVVLIMAVAT